MEEAAPNGRATHASGCKIAQILNVVNDGCSVLFTVKNRHQLSDGYYVAYKPITLSCILFMFIEMKFIHCHSCVMFAMKSMSMCND